MSAATARYEKVGGVTVFVDEVCEPEPVPGAQSAYRTRLQDASVIRAFRRLREATAAELRARSVEKARVATERVAYAIKRPRWDRKLLRSSLAVSTPHLADASGALGGANWRRAECALRAHFATRECRFPLDPRKRGAVVSTILAAFPDSAQQAIARSAGILDGRYDVLGYRDLQWTIAGSGHDIDWHFDPVHRRRPPREFWSRIPYLEPALGDHKIIWELNRHQHWLRLGRAAWLTGDARYGAAFRSQLRGWLDANPPLEGINWASMLELSFRSLSWIWAIHFFLPIEEDADDPWLLDLLLGLDRQMEHVSRHLSLYFSPNTHLLGEALALYVAGRVLPELRSARRWEAIGRAILVREARAQVHPDGGHAELSAHYHRYALDFYLLALTIARRTHDSVADTFAEVAGRMATFCRALANDDGRLPTIGDDDGGMLFPICGRPAADASDSLSLAAALLDRDDLSVGAPPEEVLWMLGGDLPRLPRSTGTHVPPSRLFPHTGYAVLRSPGSVAVVDVGQLGFLNGGHAHSDALSLLLSVDGHPLLIDPGTGTYTMDPEVRDRFRSTAMHNTVTLDGRPQSAAAGPFRWRTRANASVRFWKSGAGLDCIEAQHDGYLPQVHRRTVVKDDGLWLIADYILGSGTHSIGAHWHVDPAWTVVRGAPGAVHLEHPDRLHAAIASTTPSLTAAAGDPGGLGWCAPVYGAILPSPTLTASQSGPAPMVAITAIAVARRPIDLSIEPAPVSTTFDDGWVRAAIAGRGASGGIVAICATEPLPSVAPMERSGTVLRRAGQRVATSSGTLTTDARLAVLRLSPAAEPLSLTLIEGSCATWTGAGAFTLGPLPSAEDLHLDQAGLVRLSRDGSNSGINSVDTTLCVE